MKTRLDIRLRSMFVVAAIVFAQGCHSATLKTLDLNPTSMQSGSSGKAGGIGYCVPPVNPPPASTLNAPAGQMMVGFDDYFKPGAPPLPCNLVRATVFRGGLMFDVSQFDSIVSADLLLDTQNSTIRSGGPASTPAPPASFVTTLGDGIGPFSPEMPDDNEVSITGTSGTIDVGVSGQVRDWISKAHPNFGFVVWGPTGPVDQSNPPQDNDAKVSWYGNIRLQIIYNPAQNPRAPQ